MEWVANTRCASPERRQGKTAPTSQAKKRRHSVAVIQPLHADQFTACVEVKKATMRLATTILTLNCVEALVGRPGHWRAGSVVYLSTW